MQTTLRWAVSPILFGLFWCSKTWFERAMMAVGWPHSDIVKDGSTYLRRWYLTPQMWSRRVFLHQIMRSDDDRDPHDHPWNYLTVMLAGGYEERVYFPHTTRGYVNRMTPGRWAYYAAEHTHQLVVGPGKMVWTLVFAGRERRAWGFWIFNPYNPRSDRWVGHAEYGADKAKEYHLGERGAR